MMIPKKNPSTTKILFITLTIIFLFLLTVTLTSHNTFSLHVSSTPPPGAISPILHSQNLSHGSFHNADTKPYLLDLVTTRPSQSVVIIGLARGGEAVRIAKTHKVHAFEPMPNYVKLFSERKRSTTANVTLYPVAATAKNGRIEVRYRGVRKKVPARRAAELLPRDISPAVVSADVQGGEYEALRGLGRVLERTASVWVEVGCRPGRSPIKLLTFLDRNFVLFDFVPWGKKQGVDEQWAREQFLEGQRPDRIHEWARWFCDAAQEFQWLQTDVLGVSRELLNERPDIMQGLAEVGERNCHAGCYFREALGL